MKRVEGSLQSWIQSNRYVACMLGVVLSSSALAHAERGGKHARRLHVAGFQAFTQVVSTDPAQPRFLSVQVDGEGGLTQVGQMRGFSTRERVDERTGAFSVDYTLQASNGDELELSGSGSSHEASEGRVTFSGNLKVVSGTGRFAEAEGVLHVDGWTRTTDAAAGLGFGLFSLDGDLRAPHLSAQDDFSVSERGVSVVDGDDFTYHGQGRGDPIGRYADLALPRTSPASGFVGIIDGRYTVLVPFAMDWDVRDGGSLQHAGVEVLHFQTRRQPDGTLGPDFARSAFAEVYLAVANGTGAFAEAEGVLIGSATFDPQRKDPSRVAVELDAEGTLSSGSDGDGHCDSD